MQLTKIELEETANAIVLKTGWPIWCAMVWIVTHPVYAFCVLDES